MPKSEKGLAVREETPLPEAFQKYQPLRKVLNEIDPQGEKVSVEYVFNRPVLVQKVRFLSGELGPFAFVNFADENGVLYNMTIGGQVVLEKLGKVIDRLPLVCTFFDVAGGKFGHYYDVE